MVNLTDSAKNIRNSYRYYAFGGILSSTEEITNPCQFTGEEYDADAGLLYLRARYYDPEIGRFISRDPLIEKVALASGKLGCVGCGGGEGGGLAQYYSQPMGLHPYVYCVNNPVNAVDYSGKDVYLCRRGAHGFIMVGKILKKKKKDKCGKTKTTTDYQGPAWGFYPKKGYEAEAGNLIWVPGEVRKEDLKKGQSCSKRASEWADGCVKNRIRQDINGGTIGYHGIQYDCWAWAIGVLFDCNAL